MNFDKYTVKAQEMLQHASSKVQGAQQQVIHTAHLLSAIIQADENVFSFISKKLNVNTETLKTVLDREIESYPKSSGGQPYLSNDAQKALQFAERKANSMGDEFIALEHVFMGILEGNDSTAQMLKDAGFVYS